MLLPGFVQYNSYILVQFPSSFFFIRLVSVRVMHPYNRIDMTTVGENSVLFCRISLTSIFNNQSTAVHGFASRILMLFSEPSFSVEIFLFDSNTCTSLCQHSHGGQCHLLPAPDCAWGICLGWCICLKHFLICIVCVRNSLCWVTEKPFSLVRSIDVQRTYSRWIMNRYGANVFPYSKDNAIYIKRW